MSLLTEKTFETAAVRVNYAEGPAGGPPVVLVHGLGSRWQAWLTAMPSLLPRWHVFAIDLRGHGKSGRVPDSYRWVDYCPDVIDFLRGVAGEAAVLIGHSLGGVVSAKVAADTPDLVRAAVLEDPPLYIPVREAASPFAERFRVARDIARSGKSLLEMVEAVKAAAPEEEDAAIARDRARSLSLLDPEVYTPSIEGLNAGSYDTDAILGGIKAPVLLVQGNTDLGGALADDEAARAVRLTDNCTHVQLRDVGHGIHRERPVEFRRIVADFLESLQGP